MSRKIIGSTLALMLCFALFYTLGVGREKVIPTDAGVTEETSEIAEEEFSTILMEGSTGQVLMECNSHERRPVGTLNKIMTTLLIAEAIARDEISEDTMVSASKNASGAAGASIWLVVGEKLSVRDMLKGIIIGNANDACIAMAECLAMTEENFVELMNERASELGMVDTVFENCTGYDTDGQYSTAYDMAILARELTNQKHEFLFEYMSCWRDFLRGDETELVNSNTLVKNYNGIIGVKAGYTEKSSNTLVAAAKRDDATYISVVLGCPDKDRRFKIGKNLLNIGFSNYQVLVPTVNGEFIAPLRVRGGVDSAVEIEALKLSGLVVPIGTSDNVSSVLVLPNYIEAPVKAGQKVGAIAFYRDEELIYETELVTISDVKKNSVGYSFKKLLHSLLK